MGFIKISYDNSNNGFTTEFNGVGQIKIAHAVKYLDFYAKQIMEEVLKNRKEFKNEERKGEKLC